MTTRHLSVRIGEHLHSKVRSAVEKHINNCHVCKEKPVGVNNFKIVRTYSTEYNTKTQEALLIEKCNPKLNSQFYANDSSFLLNVFYLVFFQVSVLRCLLVFNVIRWLHCMQYEFYVYEVWLKRNWTDVTDCATRSTIGNQHFYSVA